MISLFFALNKTEEIVRGQEKEGQDLVYFTRQIPSGTVVSNWKREGEKEG